MRVKKTHIIDSVVRAAAKKRVQPANHQNKVELKGIPDTDIVEFMIDSFNAQIQDQKKRDLENILKSFYSEVKKSTFKVLFLL